MIKHVRTRLCLLLLILIPASVSVALEPATIGKVVVKQKPVFIERDGKSIRVGGFGALLQENDLVVTTDNGKALITLNNGDTILVARHSKLRVEAGREKSGVLQWIKLITGKIRSQIHKKRHQNIRIATSNALIGVKGTDFVVRYQDGMTQVATVEGLVQLASLATAQSIDIPPGKMSEIGPSGEVLPLREIAGEIMSGVEIAGEKMAPDDISGQRITQ